MSAPLLSLAIMAHPSREHFVKQLLPQLPGATVVYDEKSDRWDTGRRSMMAHDPSARFHLVVQDDAVLCNGFVNHAHKALATVRRGPVSFYTGKGAVNPQLTPFTLKRARIRGMCWISFKGPWWGVAVAVETRDIHPMLKWCDQRLEMPNYDRRMAAYFDSINRQCLYSVPSIVDHRHGPENPSLVPNRGFRGRHALYFERDPKSVWTDKLYRAPLKDPSGPPFREQMRAMLQGG